MQKEGPSFKPDLKAVGGAREGLSTMRKKVWVWEKSLLMDAHKPPSPQLPKELYREPSPQSISPETRYGTDPTPGLHRTPRYLLSLSFLKGKRERTELLGIPAGSSGYQHIFGTQDLAGAPRLAGVSAH